MLFLHLMCHVPENTSYRYFYIVHLRLFDENNLIQQSEAEIVASPVHLCCIAWLTCVFIHITCCSDMQVLPCSAIQQRMSVGFTPSVIRKWMIDSCSSLCNSSSEAVVSRDCVWNVGTAINIVIIYSKNLPIIFSKNLNTIQRRTF